MLLASVTASCPNHSGGSPATVVAGRDPKPFPPPMKLCKEMVDAMGGQDSEHYRQFKVGRLSGWVRRQPGRLMRAQLQGAQIGVPCPMSLLIPGFAPC